MIRLLAGLAVGMLLVGFVPFFGSLTVVACVIFAASAAASWLGRDWLAGAVLPLLALLVFQHHYLSPYNWYLNGSASRTPELFLLGVAMPLGVSFFGSLIGYWLGIRKTLRSRAVRRRRE